MARRKIFVIFLLIFTVLLSSFAFYAYQVLFSPNILVDKEDRLFFIPKGATFKTVQSDLYDNGYVQDLLSFSFLCRLMEYDRLIKPGKYLLKANMTNLEAVRLLRSGKQETVNVTFNNIRLRDEIAEKITQNLALTPEEFSKALETFTEDNSYGFDDRNVIAMFLPNTYQLYYNTTSQALIERMYQEYRKFWNEERMARAEGLGLTPLEVSTLASIVQAESMKRDESPVIAGLYINRLKRGIALQADPTLVFASGDFTMKRVLNKHKEIDSPYNTYKYRGLPPGPINMPNLESLDAVLNYDKHNYLYMCAREDFSGYHNFATNLRDHLANARRYQRALTIEQRKARRNNR